MSDLKSDVKSYLKLEKGQYYGKWILSESEPIGIGGNGEVWKAESPNDFNKVVAIKFFHRISDKGDKDNRYTRFKDEINVLNKNKDIKGLLKIIAYDLPEKPNKNNPPWYSMPLATPIMKYINEKTPEQIIDIIICVSETLTELHKRNISHRDIKPDNILVLGNSIFLSDFGLVDYPGKTDITKDGKDFGPHWTIAPEMKRSPQKSDGKKADIYSLAKTMWILLTGEDKGFEGQYNTGTKNEIKLFQSSIYHGTLDDLLHKGTDDNPESRPDINVFLSKLREWKITNADFKKKFKSQWIDFQKKMFPFSMPQRVIWEDINDIITTLNIICEFKQINHTLLPTGGGFDLEGVKPSFEEGCIELDLNGFIFIVKPKTLIFESFEDNLDCSYLRLETGGLELVGKYENSIMIDEELTELEPCVYTDYECYEFKDFNGKPLPTSARRIVRFSRGSFLICLRTGIYNSIPDTYDGRHNKVRADEFRYHIEKMITDIERDKKKSTTKGKENQLRFKKPIFKKSTKFNKGSRFLSDDEIKLINKVIVFHKKAKKEYNRLKKKYGLEGSYDAGHLNTKAIVAYYNIDKESIFKKKFEEFLESLSDEDLALIETVMYGGREASNGRAPRLDEMLDDSKEDNRESRIHAITEKVTLDNYLKAGIKAYRQDFKM